MSLLSEFLPAGYELHRYKLIEVLGKGGFGITYKAEDIDLRRLVVIKEYFPGAWAQRDKQKYTVAAIPDQMDLYRYGLKKFLDEARTLARFDAPNLVSVLDFFKANGTAYFVMKFEQGQDLSEFLSQRGKPLDRHQAKQILLSMLSALDYLHRDSVVHRDIKPGNIYLRDNGEPLLLDFGAARQALSGQDQALTRVYSPRYAPPEQYDDSGDNQGPWTDFYALGATLYFAITGTTLVEATVRTNALLNGEDDPIVPAAARLSSDDYDAKLLQAIDWMFQPRIKDRPQSVAQIRDLLNLPVAQSEADKVVVTEPSEQTSPAKRRWPWLVLLCVLVLVFAPLPKLAKFRHAVMAGVAAQFSATDSAVVGNSAPTLAAGNTVFVDSLAGGGKGPEMYVLKEGSFQMGSDSGDADEKPRHLVWVDKFAISRFEVTNAQFRRFVRESGYSLTARRWRAKQPLQPVAQVTWYDVQAFTVWLSEQTGARYSLPSEAQWEYAANKSGWPKQVNVDDANYHGQKFRRQSLKVGSFVGLEIFDMAGNVWEWTADCYIADYRDAPTTAVPRQTQDCRSRVLRGGGWDSRKQDVRMTNRYRYPANAYGLSYGFRVVRELP